MAVRNSDKKIHLFIEQFNKSSFSQKNIFTIVYLIAHVEVNEI